MEKLKKINTNYYVIMVIVLVVAGVFISRGIGLTYNMSIHPDERVFYKAAESLAEYISGEGVEYIEVKEYPEGAYIFQMPFQLLRRGVESITGLEQDAATWGRISSVFYFAVAVVIGMMILWEFLGGSIVSMVIYGFTMIFSLFFIEHSRYGVGDMISLFLLMCIVYLTAKSIFSNRERSYLFAACAVAGAMGAVKYPLLLFILIPICSFAYRNNYCSKRKAMYIVLFAGTSLLTFLLFSPKAMLDWGYFGRVIEREGAAYITEGTAFEAGGILNHIAEIVLYSLLYSDFPGAILILVFGFSHLFINVNSRINIAEDDDEKVLVHLFHLVIPIMLIFFFVYNLFASLLIFRTYTPYFGLSALYVSYFVAKVINRRGVQRIVVNVLIAVMVVRGMTLIALTSSQERISETFAQKVCNAADEGWNKYIVLTPYNIPIIYEGSIQRESKDLIGFVDANDGRYEIAPGTLLTTGAYEYSRAGDYIFPGNTNDAEIMETWNEFTKKNASYFVDQSYPDWVYYLFGGWIRGGTLSSSLMPCNYIYYRPMEMK